jgi:hypothetical protein
VIDVVVGKKDIRPLTVTRRRTMIRRRTKKRRRMDGTRAREDSMESVTTAERRAIMRRIANN